MNGAAFPPKPVRTAVPPPPAPRHSVQGLAEGAEPRRIQVFPGSTASSSSSGVSTGPIDQHSAYVTVHSSPDSALSGPRNGPVRWRDKNGLTVITDGRRATIGDGFVDSEAAGRHQRMMGEEEELLERGLAAAAKLSNWLNGRLSSLRTRAKLLGKSMVPLDSAVHEEKLNYLRAHVAELSRRINGVVESSERGFPSQLGGVEVGRRDGGQTEEWLKKQNAALTEEVSRATAALRRAETERAELAHRLRLQGGSKSPSPLSSSTPSPPSNNSSGYRSHPGLLHYAQPTPLILAPAPTANPLRRPPPSNALHPHNSAPDPIANLYKDYQATLI